MLPALYKYSKYTMPYKRRYYKKRYTRKYRKGPWWARPKTLAGIGATALTALKVAKEAKSLLNVEFKNVDNNIISGTTITTAGSFQCLNQITLGGDTHGVRDGNEVKMKSARLKIRAVHNPSGSNQQFLRLLIFIYKEPRITNPAVTDILETASVLSHVHHDHKRRFVILKDKVYQLDTANKESIFLDYYKKFNMSVHFDDANTIPEKHGFYVMFVSSEASNGPTVDVNSRILFLDN